MHHVRIKMCGMTRQEDISHALALGVNAIGIIFYPHSTRYVTVEQTKKILRGLPPFVDTVAVFVNPKEALVEQVITELPIDYLQFHGDESPQFCAQFAWPYIKAVPAISAEIIKKQCEEYAAAKAILLDTPSTQRGGSGKPFDWQIIPPQPPQPIILAGGLTAENVNLALKQFVPYAVDVCSGVEQLPGIKDPSKMNQFVDALWGKR